MGTVKTPSKKGRSPAKDRHTPSKTLKSETSPTSSTGTKTPEKKETPRDTTYTHHLPTDEQRKGNGRFPGRNLIQWGRPRMAEKLLLHIHYECSRHRINIPWDAIAHRLHPGSSGPAVLQHVHRLRKDLLSEGHLVPPVAQKNSSAASQADPHIRGYVRKDPDENDKETTRPVRFEEKMEDPKYSLPGAYDNNDDEDQECNETNGTPSEEDVEFPDTPTPIRRVHRGPIAIPQYNMRPPMPIPRSNDRQAVAEATNVDGIAKNQATPSQDTYAMPRDPYWYSRADGYPPVNYSSDERSLFPHGGCAEGSRGVKRRAPHDPTDYEFRRPPFHSSYELHPGFYGTGPHGPYDPRDPHDPRGLHDPRDPRGLHDPRDPRGPYGYPPHSMGFPVPPQSPYHGFDRRDLTSPPATKNQEIAAPAKDVLPTAEKAEVTNPEPEILNDARVEELLMLPTTMSCESTTEFDAAELDQFIAQVCNEDAFAW